jgi:FAD/FMN-containing dehydrogenase
MNRLDSSQRSYLRSRYGDRVTFRRGERRHYGHDSVTAPPSARPVIGETVPDAVVQPTEESELLELARWASAEGVALTPRGCGTSRSGGAVPLRRGVVVDFRRMDRLIDVDARSRTATVEPGIVWQRLDTELARHGFALRLYPTSYAGSTAGGWLAHGGAGLGSFEAGWFRRNVVDARIVVPSGGILELDESQVDLVSDAEGTTGLISRFTLRVAPIAEIAVTAAATADPASLQALLENVVDAGLPLWSVSFVDPGLAAFHEAGPEEYVVSFAFLRSKAPWVASTLPWVVHDSAAWLLDEDLAVREWDQRFRTMRIRDRIPSLVPAEVVVPLAELADVLDQFDDVIGRPVPKEAVLIRSESAVPEVAIHAFVPVDADRGISREDAVADALRMVGIAERLGGRPYSTGIYYRDRAEDILGWRRVGRIEAFKSEVDPQGILNPGKVMGVGTLGADSPISRAADSWFGGRVDVLMRP